MNPDVSKRIVVSDANVLINLLHIDRLDLIVELDGYEFNEIYDRTGQQVYHVMFIDSHYTFWGQGKSYLCRFIDTLNMGLIDELIVGKEVLTRWREVLTEFAK